MAGGSKQRKVYTKTPKGATAPCWKLAIIDPNNEDNAIGQVQNCVKREISHGGKNGAKYSTQNVTYHMDRYLA